MPRSKPPAPDPNRPLPTQQARAQQTTDRLLNAAEELLATGGAEAATLRAIADRAGMSLGTVYRRFPDKDAVLRSVYVRFFERAAASNKAGFANPRVGSLSIATLVRAMIRGMATGITQQRGLLRALTLYARTHDNADFRLRAEALNEAVYGALGEIFAQRGAEMDHPRPPIAARFMMKMAGACLHQQLLFGESSEVSGLSDEAFVAETIRAALRYLGVSENSSIRHP